MKLVEHSHILVHASLRRAASRFFWSKFSTGFWSLLGIFFCIFGVEIAFVLGFNAPLMLRQSLPTCPFRGSSKILKHLFFILFAAGLCSAPARAGFAQEASEDAASSAKFDEGAPYYLQGLDKGLVFGAAITGGVGLGLGILFTSLSFAAAADASALNDEILASPVPGCTVVGISPTTGQSSSSLITSGKCGELETALEDRDAYRVGAVVGFVTAGAALLAIGGYALIGQSDQKREAWVFAPVIGPNMGGFALQGHF